VHIKLREKTAKHMVLVDRIKHNHKAVGPGHKSRVSSKILSKALRKDSNKFIYEVEKKKHYEVYKSIFSESSKKPNTGFSWNVSIETRFGIRVHRNL